MTADPIEELVRQLRAASATAHGLVGTAPVGTRAVELGASMRWYLCAFEGPAFLWLDAEERVETDESRRLQVAIGALMVEHAESLIDERELQGVGAVARRLRGRLDAVEVDDALVRLDVTTEALAVWRGAPARAIASVPALDVASQLHEAARAAYESFVAATDPLVERQDELPGEAVQSLQELEQAAGRAAIDRALAGVLAESIDAIEAGAREMVAAPAAVAG